MDLLTIVFLLVLGLLISNIVGHYIPFIPMALTQIVLGIIVALVTGNYTFEIGAEWFLLLFVAPLLYNDGRHFSRDELWGMRFQIFGNAFILVILTTILCGYLINLLIPGIQIPAALALAAILSPTDPVAVNGIAKRIRVPEKVMVLVRGESLINDASGLVAFNYAIAAAVTGYFSLREAILDFSYTFLIGAAAGIFLGLLIIFIRFRLRKSGINDPVFHSLLQILTPFGVYIVTEDILHASGVIAVVTAGIIHSVVREHTETYMAEEQLLTENTWSILLFVLNGFVFLLLGLNIPSAMFDTISSPDLGNWLGFGYVAAIGLAILAIRFIWSFVSKANNYYFRKRSGAEKPEIRTALITTLAGVRGTVTMAGVLTVPAFLGNGEIFPERSLLIFIAAGVILLLLILATLFLPLLCKKEAPVGGAGEQGDLTWAKNKLLLSAIKKIKAETNGENELAALQLINEYTASFQRNLSGQKSDQQYAEHYNRKINEARLLALNLQRKYISNLLANEEIDISVFDILSQFLDYREEALNNNLHFETKFFLKRALRDFGRLGGKQHRNDGAGLDDLHFVRDIQISAMRAAVEGLTEYAKTQEQPEYVYAVLLDYEKMLQRFKRTGRDNDRFEVQKEELRFKVLDAERSEMRRMYEAGEITSVQEKELRRFTNYIESIVLYEHNE
ncbi:Na+/H+ antiporter [Desulfosporosinus meridiei]|uniref:Na+ antiporter n=1 Tax=Desulfosporosinus meridiei (strain ATCC BAA-275 / DSM 13257 / KCTC 12902 / NCIMB 13706 / S10) TaxID=768704 RepID=J7IQ82_DESMD|nr:Na+/H+ antiporter [Desulfosporosinus meridiei]AFQ43780.1 Na+ antiporter [Desulfosporosinus meridiei DSM 13257]